MLRDTFPYSLFYLTIGLISSQEKPYDIWMLPKDLLKNSKLLFVKMCSES